MIKAVFFDIDGTLVSHTISDIPPGVLEALDALRDKGIRVFAATGRHISEFPALPLHGYPFDGYVTQTGLICYDSRFEIIWDRPFSEAVTKKITALFERKEIPLVLRNDRCMYINFVNDVVVRTQESIHTPVPPADWYRGEKLFGATVFGDSDQIRQTVALLPGLRESRWHAFGADLVPEEAGKEEGIRQMLAWAGIDKAETMAFGDADNDLDMIRFAGIGIAMGNGTPLLKENADYVTASVDEGGIPLALKHFGLI